MAWNQRNSPFINLLPPASWMAAKEFSMHTSTILIQLTAIGLNSLKLAFGQVEVVIAWWSWPIIPIFDLDTCFPWLELYLEVYFLTKNLLSFLPWGLGFGHGQYLWNDHQLSKILLEKGHLCMHWMTADDRHIRIFYIHYSFCWCKCTTRKIFCRIVASWVNESSDLTISCTLI